MTGVIAELGGVDSVPPPSRMVNRIGNSHRCLPPQRAPASGNGRPDATRQIGAPGLHRRMFLRRRTALMCYAAGQRRARMTLPLSLEVEQLARLVAIKTGKSLDAVIREALEERARAVGLFAGAPRRRFDEARVRSIIKRVSALPILDDRTPDEIVGYNECGVPE
jgi:antitoxin VapB